MKDLVFWRKDKTVKVIVVGAVNWLTQEKSNLILFEEGKYKPTSLHESYNFIQFEKDIQCLLIMTSATFAECYNPIKVKATTREMLLSADVSSRELALDVLVADINTYATWHQGYTLYIK